MTGGDRQTMQAKRQWLTLPLSHEFVLENIPGSALRDIFNMFGLKISPDSSETFSIKLPEGCKIEISADVPEEENSDQEPQQALKDVQNQSIKNEPMSGGKNEKVRITHTPEGPKVRLATEQKEFAREREQKRREQARLRNAERKQKQNEILQKKREEERKASACFLCHQLGHKKWNCQWKCTKARCLVAGSLHLAQECTALCELCSRPGHEEYECEMRCLVRHSHKPEAVQRLWEEHKLRPVHRKDDCPIICSICEEPGHYRSQCGYSYFSTH